MKRIQLFRPGRFTAMSGKVIEFTEEQLKDAASVYDPDLYAAPIVAGHPKVEDPNYGLVGALEFSDDGHLYAVPSDVDPGFEDLVKAKRFNTVSAAWYMPDAKANPKPGHLYPKHVGFLGAVPPSLKGLKSPSASFAEFSEDGEEVTCFADLQSWDIRTIGDLFRGIRDFFIEKHGKETADKVLPDYSIEQIQQAANRPDPDDAQPSYTEATPKGDTMTDAEKAAQAQAEADKKKADEAAAAKLAEDQAKLEAEKKATEERAKELEARENKLQEADLAHYAEGLIKEGKMLPAEKAGFVEFAMALDRTETVEFSEGEGDKIEKKPKTRLTWLKDFLSSRPAIVQFGESVKTDDKPEDIANFAAPDGSSVTPESVALFAEVKAYQKSHNCDIQTAYTAVTSKKG